MSTAYPASSSQPYSQSAAYPSYSVSYAHYPSQTHYPAANYAQLQPAAVPYSYPVPSKTSPDPELKPLTGPAALSVDADVASTALRRLISAELQNEGFEAAEPAALLRLEKEFVAFIDNIHCRAQEYANLANRASPLVNDVVLACEENGLKPEELRVLADEEKERKKNKKLSLPRPLTLLPAPSSPPPPELLPSDDEGSAPVIPITLRGIPHYYPKLPPKHTYLRTPPSPPKKQALPTLEKKLKNASLVQESLKNLLIATEDTNGPDDSEMLGAIVNWEGQGQPRKRWKLSSQ